MRRLCRSSLGSMVTCLMRVICGGLARNALTTCDRLGRSYTPFWYPDTPFQPVPRVVSGAWSLCRLSGSVSSQWKRPSGPIVFAEVLQPAPEKSARLYVCLRKLDRIRLTGGRHRMFGRYATWRRPNACRKSCECALP
jgi:hypothetical protein